MLKRCTLAAICLLCFGVVYVPTAELTHAAPLKKIVVVFKTHFDIGYSDRVKEVVQDYRTEMIDKALEVCETYRDLESDRQFVWTVPGWPMAQILWDGQTPQRRKRVAEAFRKGQFVIHALPFTTHTETLDLEDLVRGMGFSSQLSRDFGLELPRDAKMTDVPCHSWVVPTLLKKAGVDFIQIGCNDWSATAQTPLLFQWEGPDGSQVLTMLCPKYGSDLFPPKDWPYSTWLAVLHTYDNVGPPSPEYVKGVFKKVHDKLPEVEVKIGRMSDFSDAILADSKASVPVVRGDMPDTWIHGPMSDPHGAKIARTIRPLIGAADALNTELCGWGLKTKGIHANIANAYEQSLLYGEHTWGGATQTPEWGNGIRYGEEWKKIHKTDNWGKLEASWEDHSNYIRAAEKIVKPILDEQLKALAKVVNVDGQRIVVFNPLPWKRDGLVLLQNTNVSCGAVQDAESKTILPVEQNGDQLRFFARDIPPMGYRTYVLAKTSAAATHATVNAQIGTMENKFFKVELDATNGTIRSLIDKRTGRELVDSSAPHALGQYLYERFDADRVAQYVNDYTRPKKVDPAIGPNLCFGKPNLPPASKEPYRAASPKDFELRFEQTPVAAVAIMKAAAGSGIPQPVEVRLVMYHDQPYLDFEVTLQDKPLDPWPEAGWLCLPLKVNDPSFKLGRLGAVTDLKEETLPGSNRDILCLKQGAAMVGPDGKGVAIYAMDSSLVSFQRPGIYRYSPDFLPEKSWAYVNLFNNAWSTNFRDWIGGTWTSRVRLWTVDHYEAEASLVTPSVESRCPLLAVTTNAPSGDQPTVQAGLGLSRKGVLVTAFGSNPDGSGLLLRLWEQAGHAGNCTVKLPAGLNISHAQPVDLRGRPFGEPIPVSNGTFTTQLDAFAPASFVLVKSR